MPYCRKCEAKLDEAAGLCHVCGTPVVAGTPKTRSIATKRRRSFYVLPFIILIAVLVSAIVISALFFLPFYLVHFNQKVPKANVNHLLLEFQAEVAQVNVFFENMSSNTAVGGTKVDVQRFSGDQSPLQSSNYPAGGNFLVYLKTTPGRININAAYGASTVLRYGICRFLNL